MTIWQRAPRQTILVLSEHGRGDGWMIRTWRYGRDPMDAALREAATAIKESPFDHVTFLEVHVPLDLGVTDIGILVGKLGPAIRARQIGKIHGKRDRVPLERPMLGQAGVSA